MPKSSYLMENEQETLRLKVKTDRSDVERQARWAGIKPGMRVADIGCGPGITTQFLNELVQPGGNAVGVDFSEERIAFAKDQYSQEDISFVCRDIYDDLSDLGKFDFIWVRFVLEYHGSRSFEIVRNLGDLLNPGGILCLIDLDQNCLCHFNPPEKLSRTLQALMQYLTAKHDFDPYVGRKLYTYLYDLGFKDIDVFFSAHHLIFGELADSDFFNWKKKVRVTGEKSGFRFDEYDDGIEGFYREFLEFFDDPRRFTYTPLICCRGKKPLSS